MAEQITAKVPEKDAEPEEVARFLEELKKVINAQAKELAELKILVASLHP